MAYGQEEIEFIDRTYLVNKIDSLREKNDYENIVKLIEKTNKNDSLYIPFHVSKSYYLMQLGEYKEAIEVTKEGLIDIEFGNRLSFYINQSIAYRRLDDYKNSIETLDNGLKEFPKSYELYYQQGIVYQYFKHYDEAIKSFKLSAILNPFNANIHLKLGNLCHSQHLTAQALMCYNTYLLLNPDGNGSFEVLNSVNKIMSKNNENEPVARLKLSKDDNSFKEIDLILDNKVGLNKDYKIENEINIAFIKQNHVLFKLLKLYKGNDGFWDRKYVKLHKWIEKNNYFDDFVYTSTYSIKNPDFKKIVEKKTERVKAFYKLFKDKWKEIMEVNNFVFQGEVQPVSFYYSRNLLNGIGKMRNGVFIGKWEFYDSKGQLFSTGPYNDKGKRTGQWTWFYKNGSIDESSNYLNGKLEGESIGYYSNGKLLYKTIYKNDELDGSYKRYNKRGALVQDKMYISGKLNGKYYSYYDIGQEALEYDVKYDNGAPVGTVLQYSLGKEKIFEVTYQNGVKEGLEISYYLNGAKKREVEYVNGNFQGSYKSYNKNEVLIEEGVGVEDENSGIWKEYYPNGKIKTKKTYKKGKLDGSYIEYASNGKLYYEDIYRKGELIGYKFYNQEGEIIKEANKKGGEFYYEGYSVYGNKTAEGLYNIKGGLEGKWKYYTANGVLSSKGTYKNRFTTGKYYNYYNNGQIEAISTYVNDTLSGYYKKFHKNEKLAVQGWYKKGLAQKEWRYYYKNGTLSNIHFYHNGELHGKQKDFSGEGKLVQIQLFKYGELVGQERYNQEGLLLENINYKSKSDEYKIVTHYSNKKKFIETSYKFGVRHGLYKYWDFDGNIIIQGSYLNDNMSGEWLWYYPNGKIERKANLINGEYHGVIYDYYKNGKLETKTKYNLGDKTNASTYFAEDGTTITGRTEYLGGKMHGRKEFYSKEGKLQLVRFYEYGRLIGYTYQGKKGVELPMIEIKNETAKIIAYFDNGKKSREMEIVNGDVENTYRSYYYNGQLHKEHFYKNDDYTGKLTTYYPNGKLKEEIMYSDDEKNGQSKKYYENGQLKETSNYINDLKTGTAKYYDVNGKLIKVEKYFNDDRYE